MDLLEASSGYIPLQTNAPRYSTGRQRTRSGAARSEPEDYAPDLVQGLGGTKGCCECMLLAEKVAVQACRTALRRADISR